MTFLPDGRLLVTEKKGALKLLDVATGKAGDVSGVPSVDYGGQGGFGDVVLHPQFASNGMVYISFAEAGEGAARGGAVARGKLTLDANGGGALSDVNVIWRQVPKVAGRGHYGHRIAFGPDGMLYAATGDAGTSSRSQDQSSNAGKILRMQPDGGVPVDNPTQGSLVYASGFRDPQGISWDAQGRLYADEFGPDRDDEVNVVVPGGNYGWPTVTGVAGDSRFVDPIVVRQPAVASWSGNAVLVGGAIPQWEGDLFVAALRGTRLYRFDLASDGSGAILGTEELFVGDFGRIRHVEQAPDGSLWLLTSNRDGRGSPVADDDRVVRIGPA